MQNLLAQSPSNHCTPTSDLIELVVQARNSYGNFEAFKSQGIFETAPRIKKALKGMIRGYYDDEFNKGKTIIEKSRGWLAYIELIEEILERPIKIICCVRDIREIVASFEKLYRTNQLTKKDAVGAAYFDCQTIDGRMMQLLSTESVLGLSINRLRDVFDRGLDDRLIIVRYSELISDPVSMIIKTCMACDLQPFICKQNDVQQITHEDDGIHGMKLHEIRPVVDDKATKWDEILPKRLGDFINEKYTFMQELAGVNL